MRIGLYGGTFDPPHLGHTHAALAAHQGLSLDQTHMILAARPDHRDQPQTPNTHRWEMLRLACLDHPELEADATELERPGKSYAIDTLESFRQRQPDAQLCWILGMDSYVTLPSWHRWQELLALGHLVVLQRPGHQGSIDQPLQRVEQTHRSDSLGTAPAGRILYLSAAMKEVSASAVRRLREAGGDPEHLLDPRVWSYIKEHRLYQGWED